MPAIPPLALSETQRRCAALRRALGVLGLISACSGFAADTAMTPHPPSTAFDAYPIIDTPLPGYEAIGFRQGAVHFRNCELAIGANGLPTSIRHDGVDLLAGAMRLSGRVDGADIGAVAAAVEVTRNADTEVSFAARGAVGGASLSIRTVVEYDGLARFILDFESAQPVAFEDLSIHIPIDAEQADYFYDFKSYAMPDSDGVVWNSQKSRAAGVSIGRFMNMFAPYIWIGNYQRGISWFAESDINWQDRADRPVWTIVKRDGVVELKVDVIMGTAHRQRFVLDFGIMVTPVRRFARESHDWVFTGMSRDYWDMDEDTLPEGAYGHIPEWVDRANVLMFSSDFNNALEERHAQHIAHPRELSRYVRAFHSAGFSKVIYYTCMNLVTSQYPRYDELAPGMRREPILLREWPGKRVPGAEQREFLSTCLNSPQNLAMVLDVTRALVAEHDVDGIYLDNFMYTYNCRRPGCAVEKRGLPQPRFLLYQYRDFMKKLASIFVANGKDPLIWVHHTGIMNFPSMSLATMGLSGEIMSNKNKSRYNHIELFDEATAVVEFNATSWGVPILWYPDIKYGFYTRDRPDAPLTSLEYSQKYGATYLAMCMLYGSIPVSMNADPGATIFTNVTAARYAFGLSADDAVFVPYWEPASGVRIVQAASAGGEEGRKEVKASWYVRDGKILVVLVNFDSRPAKVELVLDNDHACRAYQGYQLRNYVDGAVISLQQAPTRADEALPGHQTDVTLPGHGFALLLGEAGTDVSGAHVVPAPSVR